MSSAHLSTNHLANGVRSICLATFLTCPRTPLSSAAVHRGEHWLSAPCCRAHPNSFGVHRHTEDISYAHWEALDIWLTAACLPAWAMNRHTEDISYAHWDALDLWLTAACLSAMSAPNGAMLRRVPRGLTRSSLRVSGVAGLWRQRARIFDGKLESAVAVAVPMLRPPYRQRATHCAAGSK